MYDDYIPQPIDISKIVLSDDLIQLVHAVAFNQHELMTNELKKTNWRFGDSMSVIERTHPSLMPYDELTDIQKEHYLSTAFSVIKTMLAMGYRIYRDNKTIIS